MIGRLARTSSQTGQVEECVEQSDGLRLKTKICIPFDSREIRPQRDCEKVEEFAVQAIKIVIPGVAVAGS